MGKDEGLVCDLVNEVRNRELHRHEGPQARAVSGQKRFKSLQFPTLNPHHELVFDFLIVHKELYPHPADS